MEDSEVLGTQFHKSERQRLVSKAVRKLNDLKVINRAKIKHRFATMDPKDLLPCQVKCLEHVNDLARKYRGRLNLNLVVKQNCSNLMDPKIYAQLQVWEKSMNSASLQDPYISVENFVDDEGPPSYFHYVTEMVWNKREADVLLDPQFLVGCRCDPRCSAKYCSCPKDSGGHFAYDRAKRVLIPPGSPIYECNKNCACMLDCPNRVIQKGMTVRVCIFRTHDGRGWGLKTKEFIPNRKFVVEYVGELITSEEAERRGRTYDALQQTYLFDLDFYDEDAHFTVDAYQYGNVSHFINHSCDPNLLVYSVWVDSLDPRLPRIGLFAARDIKPGEELTFDYQMTSNESSPHSSPVMKARKHASPARKNFCACGAINCRKYLF